MKILKQIIPVKMRMALPILGIAGASLCVSCNEIEPEPEPTPTHTTTYVWGPHSIGTPSDLAKKVRASADSTTVSKVILQSDGDKWNGRSVSDIYDKVVKVIIDDCRHPEKLGHTGDIKTAGMYDQKPGQYEQCQRDSTALAALGYKFTNTLHYR